MSVGHIMASMEEQTSESERSQGTESEQELSFGDAYLEVELYMEKTRFQGPETLEIVTDPNVELEPPSVPSPSHMERKRNYNKQKLMKSYESAAVHGLATVYQTFDF